MADAPRDDVFDCQDPLEQSLLSASDFALLSGDGDVFEVTPDSLHGPQQQRAGPQDFELLRVLGTGAYGKVMLARKITGADKNKLYAMKVLKKATIVHHAKTTEHTKAERNILAMIRDVPFVVHLHYAFQDDAKLHLVLDYVNGGELFSHLRRYTMFSERDSRFYVAEILTALGALHRLGVIYRDLKLENILLDAEGHIKLTDFGLSKEKVTGMNERTYSYVGTVEYMPPEIVQEDANGHNMTADWWSLGCLLYELVKGHTPFIQYPGESDDSSKAIARRIISKDPYFPADWSDQLKDILTKLLRRDASQRLGARMDDIEIRQHPFFVSIDWTQLEQRQMKPPTVPTIQNELDVQNFDSEFTDMEPMLTPTAAVSPMARTIFRGFSFVGPNVLFNSGLFDPSSSLPAVQSSLRHEQSVATTAVQTVVPASLESSFHAPMDEDAQMPFDSAMQNSPQRSMTTALAAIPPSALLSAADMPRDTFMDITADNQPTRTFQTEYTIPVQAELGNGSYSVCRLCVRRSDNKQFAVKIISQRHKTNEVAMLRVVQGHPNIIQLVDVFEDELHKYLVTELCEGGELFRHIVSLGQFSEKHAQRVFNQLLSAVHFSHGRDVVHRDIKPENIVFVDSSPESPVKIIDWGFAKKQQEVPNLETPLFTDNYAPPEVAARLHASAPAYTAACDLWSLGVVLYTMLAGHSPFKVPEGIHIQSSGAWNDAFATQDLDLTSAPWPSISSSAKELLKALLTKDPVRRPTAAQAARYAWLNEDCHDMAEALPSPAIIGSMLTETSAARRPGKRHPGLNDVAAMTDLARLAPVEGASLLAKRRKGKAAATPVA
eukprot:m.131267 g.131267  ORF g.131267 m.131267 type:complete len:834 (+) comp15907_c0_seq1:39-2540(+)